ncbi:MAG: guanylate kinase [Bacteroidales bacterium]|nr:guanylate kinase [Bacteroidales bacterium]MCF8344483.1 guanylate kinase [Bacteroidales bacterium]MCF8352077.1 guanylate kinase [Bacteroidales bacterium]MCF8377345.1 guanylate kinase [Bacteroidales bacterium]MCF8401909.1 guanylate kinase [Bacteroidales bacterium]
MSGKLIIISAPSGAGKTTIVKHLLAAYPSLQFSVSACSRPKRPDEVDGIDYHFYTVKEFRKMIDEEAFIEWEEVYENQYYGTLKSEVNRILDEGKHVIFDIDVMGGLNIKNQYGKHALSIFIKPPSIEELERRLRNRATDGEEKIRIRLEKAIRELEFAGRFDKVILNDDLIKAINKSIREVEQFLKK